MTSSWRSLALVLVFALTPGAAEAVENVVHLVGEGHLAHAATHVDDHAENGDEHGCTSVFHACGCHAQVSFVVHKDIVLPARPTELTPDLARNLDDTPATDGARQGFFRPPIR